MSTTPTMEPPSLFAEVLRFNLIEAAVDARCVKAVREAIDNPGGIGKAMGILADKRERRLAQCRAYSADYNPAHKREKAAYNKVHYAEHRDERLAREKERKEKRDREAKRFYQSNHALSNTWGKPVFHHVVPYLKEKAMKETPFSPAEATKCIPLKRGQHQVLHFALSRAIYEATDRVCGVKPSHYGRKSCDPWPKDFDYTGWTRAYLKQERAKIDNPSSVPLDFFEALRQG